MGGDALYRAMQDVERQNIGLLQQEYADLVQAMSDAVNSGAIAKGSAAWLDTSYVVWQHTRHNLFNCWEAFNLIYYSVTIKYMYA